MRRIIGWLFNVFRQKLSYLRKDIRRVDSQLESLDKRRQESLKTINRKLREFSALEKTLNRAIEEINTEFRDARTIHNQDQDQVEQLRAKLGVANQTIEGLTEALKMYEERYRALTSIEVMRQVANTPNRQE